MVKVDILFFFKPYSAYGNRAEDIFYAALFCRRERKRLVFLFNPIKGFYYRKGNTALCRYIKSKDIEIWVLPLICNFLIHVPFAVMRIIGILIRKIYPKMGNRLVDASDFTIGRERLYGDIENIENFVDKKIDWKNDFLLNQKSPIASYSSRRWLENKIPELKNSKYICLHVRSGKFHKDDEYGRPRNSDFRNYIKSIEFLVENGYKVVRIGSERSEWVEIVGCINLDASGIEGELLDIAVIEHCDMYIGGYSGPMDIALLFGKKIYAVDIISLSHCAWNLKHSRFLPKKVKINNKIIDCKEQIKRNIFEIDGTGHMNQEVEFIGNNEWEIFYGLVEFLAEEGLTDDQEAFNGYLYDSFLVYCKENRVWENEVDDTLQKMRWITKMQNVEGGICLVALSRGGEV
jgi:putative glycosyltransferase (TIGR04372 family)